jgi:hypothetical protein
MKMPVTWNVEREADGGFVMWIPGTGPRIRARNFSELKKQGYPNGIADDLYEDVCRQLEKGDKATVAVPIFKFSQVSP